MRRNIKELLQPVHDRLQRYEETVTKVEAERRDAFGLLLGPDRGDAHGTERVSAEAAKLVNALRKRPRRAAVGGSSNSARAGDLRPRGACDFETEVSVDGRRGGAASARRASFKCLAAAALVIDAKVSLNEYQRPSEPSTKRSARLHSPHMPPPFELCQRSGRESLLVAIRDVARLRGHVHSRRTFPRPRRLELDPSLWDYAFARGVIAGDDHQHDRDCRRPWPRVWRQEAVGQGSGKIGELGKELYERLATMAADVARSARSLGLATSAYNELRRQLRKPGLESGQAVRGARRSTRKRANRSSQSRLSRRSPRSLTQARRYGAGRRPPRSPPDSR